MSDTLLVAQKEIRDPLKHSGQAIAAAQRHGHTVGGMALTLPEQPVLPNHMAAVAMSGKSCKNSGISMPRPVMLNPVHNPAPLECPKCIAAAQGQELFR